MHSSAACSCACVPLLDHVCGCAALRACFARPLSRGGALRGCPGSPGYAHRTLISAGRPPGAPETMSRAAHRPQKGPRCGTIKSNHQMSRHGHGTRSTIHQPPTPQPPTTTPHHDAPAVYNVISGLAREETVPKFTRRQHLHTVPAPLRHCPRGSPIHGERAPPAARRCPRVSGARPRVSGARPRACGDPREGCSQGKPSRARRTAGRPARRRPLRPGCRRCT